MSRSHLLAALALASATASAATFDLTVTSANGGADTLVSWNYTGTPTATDGVFWGLIWSSTNISTSYVTVTGPAYASFDSGLTTVTDLNTGLYITNTATGESAALTEFGTYGSTSGLILATSGNSSNSIAVASGQTLVLSGPTSGFFLLGVAFSNFNEGQWTLDYGNYSNFDPVLTVGPAPIPEPSTYGLALGGLVLAAAALRRRRKA